MFTGLIEEIGTVRGVRKNAESSQIEVESKKVLEGIKVGDSISTNGVCLTVVSFNDKGFVADVMPETVRRSNLRDIDRGSRVNLERALRVGDRLGGHMVSGHIDGTGKIVSRREELNATWLEIEASSEIMKYVIFKGSISIDGTSLTVASVSHTSFEVSIIPVTKDETTLLSKKVGDMVNLECDMVGKYIEKFLSYGEKKSEKRDISEAFLIENGFM